MKNFITNEEYSENNQEKLLFFNHVNKFTDTRFLTFLQAKSLNLSVKKGAKGCKILKMTIIPDAEKLGGKVRTFKYYTLFNIESTNYNELDKNEKRNILEKTNQVNIYKKGV